MLVLPDLVFRWVPPPGVLRDYETCWGPTTDAPRVYHTACALGVIASIVGSNVHLPFGGERLYPNVWALILGPSSFFRKSTTISKARRTLSSLEARSDDGNCPQKGLLLPNEFSREALLRHLSDHPVGVLTFSEFSGFLALCGRDFMGGTKELLADLYDCPSEYTKVLNSGTFTLHNPCVSILAASQTGWFLEKLHEGDLRGGFLARFTYWPAFTKPGFLAVPPQPDHALRARLLKGLNEIRQVTGYAALCPSGQKRYAEWLGCHERELAGVERAGDLSAFWSRLSVVTLKFCILLQLAKNRALTIDCDTLESALSLTEFLKEALRHLFAEEFALSRDMRNRQRVIRLIGAHPGIQRRDLLRASSLLVRQFDGIIETLREEGTISELNRAFWPSGVSVPVSKKGTDAKR